ncbi:UNVERIFIED_CONTAM: hypothetical protein FKN15_046664 [Acipenser sinensis]
MSLTHIADRQQQQDISAAVAGRARPLVAEERGAGMPRRRRNLGSRVMAQRRAQRAEEQEDEGVIDDRGKFIFITPEELSAVAQFIRQRGRVSITELAQASNSLINLTPETSAAPQVTV